AIAAKIFARAYGTGADRIFALASIKRLAQLLDKISREGRKHSVVKIVHHFPLSHEAREAISKLAKSKDYLVIFSHVPFANSDFVSANNIKAKLPVAYPEERDVESRILAKLMRDTIQVLCYEHISSNGPDAATPA
ncbi:MAG: hypothetical protein J7L14_03110, partial [Candidatus Diapherotrites archaeon]|nr:hypothetical protein [Candidatus Diapherotrites archaeon]